MRITFSAVLCALLCSSFNSAFSQPTREVAWKAESADGFSGANEICDGATGKTLGIVVCEVGKGIVCFRPDGSRIWDAPMTPPVTACPAIADVDGDGREEIVACDGDGSIAMFEEAGSRIWSSKTRGLVRAESCPAIADLDGDGVPEIVVGDTTGALNCFDRNGKNLWTFVAQGDQIGPVLIADLYDNPGREIVVTSHNGHIYALTSQGEWLWDIYHSKECLPGSTPILADVEGDGVPEIYIGGGLHHFLRIDPRKPEIVLDENVHLHVNNAILATDIDGDGKDEVVFGNKGGKVYCYDEGGFSWTWEFQNTSMSSPPFALNLDADPEMEFVFSFHGTQVLDTDGSVIAELPNPVFNGSPLAGDFDDDGKLDVVLCGYSLLASAGLQYHTWDVPYREDPKQWVAYAGNRAHTGRLPEAPDFEPLPSPQKKTSSSAAGFTPTAETNLFSGKNKWRFDIANPDSARLTFLTEIKSPDGFVQRFANHVRTVRERTAFEFQVEGVGQYTVSQTLVDADALAVLASKEESIEFAGIDGDTAYVKEVIRKAGATVESWRETNLSAANAIGDRLLSLSGKLAALGQESIGSALQSREDNLAEARKQAEGLSALATAGSAICEDGSFAAWEFCPWGYFHPVETIPAEDSRTEKLQTSLCVGEYDSLALNVTNFIGQTLDIRVWAEDLVGNETVPWGEHIEFRRSVVVPTLRRESVADALPLLDQASAFAVSSLETQQLWLTVDAVGLKPGVYQSGIHLKSIESDPTEIVLPFEIEVHDLELPRPRPLRFCVWAYGADAPEYELQDLVDHGVTIHFGVSPTGACDEDGNLVGDLEYSDHDASVKRFAPHGMLLFIGNQGSLRGQPFLSDAWKKGYVKYLRTWVKHLAEMGIGYEDFALYPYDEPSTHFNQTTLNLVEVAKVIREADPNILIYTDPTSGTNKKTLEMLEGLIDIWCPSSELLERFSDEILPFAKRVGKETWFYDAAGRAKTLSCLGIYQWRFWYAWNLGLTGAGWWTYKYGDYLWEGPNPSGDNFYHVYDGPGTIVTSKRWEAAREGIEDYEVLYLLRSAIEAAKQRGVAGSDLEAAERILSELPVKIENTLNSAGRRLPLDPDSLPLYERVTETLKKARAELVEACLRVNAMHQ